MAEACPGCGEKFVKLGVHWARSGCDYPVPSESIDEVLTGLYMGDGSLAAHGSDNPYMRWNNTNKPFLELLDEKLGWLTTGVRLKKDAQQAANERLSRNPDWKMDAGNFDAIYGTRTRRLPYFRKYESWTSSGQKRYPEELELTPTVAKYWYVSDGTVNWMRSYSARVVFACQNERDRPEFICNLFRQAGFEANQNLHMFYLSVEDSKRFLSWIGQSVPGFEYKWELTSRKRYERLRK